ncbi:MAG: hypothetical protein FJ076_00775 [Cyanobacteria bacterium K_DeepCast_35m_m1_288]|nr:hypothetical protein [Cyanobacteria bacterium K_DeepCast_35m_m1_288]
MGGIDKAGGTGLRWPPPGLPPSSASARTTPISAIADLQDLLLTTRLNGEVVEVEISGVGCLSNPVRNRS